MASGTPDIVIPDGLEPAHASVQFRRNPMRFHSRWSGRTSTYRTDDEHWHFVFEWEDLSRNDFDTLFTAFEDKGTDTPFTFYNVARALPTGAANVAALATLKVAGASQSGKSVNVDGGPNSTLIFRQGDFIGIGGWLYRVKANCTTNGSGQATISLCQYLVGSPADDADVIVSYAPVTVLLDVDPTDDIEPSEFHSFRIEASEVGPTS